MTPHGPPAHPNHNPATAVASRVKPANRGNRASRAKPGKPAHRVSPNPRAPSCNMK